ncbi:unnamed protein product [Prunus armeniaca]
MHSNKLICKAYSGSHLTYIKYPQTLEVLCKIHDGKCGNYSGGKSLAQKALNIGYFWPTMRHDSTEYVKKCDATSDIRNVIYQRSRCGPIHLEKLHLRVWLPTVAGYRQWLTIYWQANHRPLCKIQDQATPVHLEVSTRKRTGRGIQQSQIRLLEEKARRLRREMGG